MAFCKNCGTDLNGARFCPNCGTADGDLVVQHRNGAPVGNPRSNSLAEMENMQQYFGAKKPLHDKLDALMTKIEKQRSKKKMGWLISGILMSLLIWLMISGGMNWLGILIFGSIDLGLFYMFYLQRKKNKEKIENLLVDQAITATELMDHYNAYGYCPVGIEYTEPSILYTINDVIRKGRADTPKEAVNILLDDMHKEKMEQEAARAANAAEATAAYSRQTAMYSKECDRAARKAANYAAASFWL